jgi:HK97 family phage prohead protease
MDEMDELIGAVATLEPTGDLDSKENGGEDQPATTRARNPDEPYGDVAYADPGYQDDGKKRYPLDNEEHCRAAWSYINQERNAAKYSPDELKRIKARIRSALEEYGVDTEDAGRARPYDAVGEILRYDRMWALDDIVVRSGGDGRTVEAYAAVFDTPTEIKDQHGHYMEVISRSAFNRAISHGIDRIGVFYHHGMTLAGTPSDLGSVPIGSPLEVRPDGRGLRTVSRFNRSALADSVLEAIRAGDIKGYSFRGKIYQSEPKGRIPRGRTSGIPTITRTELGLSEFGPTPTPYYADAGIVAVRSPQAIAAQLTTLDEPFRRELITILARSTPLDSEQEENATPAEGPGAEDPPVEALRSASMADIRRRIAVHKILGGRK